MPEIMNVSDTFMIHHITEVGIIGMQKRSMVRSIALSVPKSTKYFLRCAVKNRKTIEQMSASTTDRIYPISPRLKVNSRKMLNTMFITVVSMPSIA